MIITFSNTKIDQKYTINKEFLYQIMNKTNAYTKNAEKHPLGRSSRHMSLFPQDLPIPYAFYR